MRITAVLSCILLTACGQTTQPSVPVTPVVTVAPASSPSQTVAQPQPRVVAPTPAAPSPREAKSSISDAEIAQQLIARSIAAYPGNCPCPYNMDRAGRRCGGRSAHSRAGGYAPLCFPDDVGADRIRAYRQAL
jgi:hypothetical protein